MTTEIATREGVQNHEIVSGQDWIKAAQELLVKEKEFTRQRDELSRQRRELPWTRVDKDYVFEGPNGTVSLSELFGGKSQLIIYHFMFAPGWDEGCSGCSFVSDHVDAARRHFEHHDIAFAAISLAPLAEFSPFKKRMGWTFDWLSSHGTTFNYDFGVSFHADDLEKGPVMYNFRVQPIQGKEQPGLTVFYRNSDGEVFRTYSTYERGLDMLVGAYNFIDLTPKGRDESGPMDWMKLHDEY
jgi:predicted dithiol-disulfide oxidoreductase (DUF899 family)